MTSCNSPFVRLEPVELGTATRSGNKKVTLVNNLETYHIDPGQFGHKCQVLCQPYCRHYLHCPGGSLSRHLCTCRPPQEVRQ